jgi:peptidoglycan/LPS O-acetylase OafA/YrhL
MGETADTAHKSIRLHSLTSLRFLAALLVLIHHLCLLLLPTTLLWKASSAGFVGVGFFFVLSGFVLTWTHRETLLVRNFYGRRVARVYPLHLATAVLAAFLLLSAGEQIPVVPAVLNIFLLQSWVPIERFGSSLNGVSWSLCCEAFFYLCFPLLVRLVARHRLVIVAAATIAAMVASAVAVIVIAPAEVAEQILYKNPLFRIGDFLLGIVLATGARRGLRSRVPVSVAAGLWILSYIADLALQPAMHWLGLTDLRVYGDLITLPATCLLILAAASSDVRNTWSLLRTNWLIRLGDASFALYMVHYLIISEWLRIFGPPATLGGGVGAAAILGGSAIAVSLVVYGRFERPAESMLRRRLGAPPESIRLLPDE